MSIIEMGCGPGALTAAILERSDPAAVLAFDPAEAFVALAGWQKPGPRATFMVGTAEILPWSNQPVDYFVSGLGFNLLTTLVHHLKQLIDG